MLKATKLPTSTHWSKPNNIAPMSARDVSLYVMEIPSTSIVPQPSTTRFLMATPMLLDEDGDVVDFKEPVYETGCYYIN